MRIYIDYKSKKKKKTTNSLNHSAMKQTVSLKWWYILGVGGCSHQCIDVYSRKQLKYSAV